jgi:hypothetical protein
MAETMPQIIALEDRDPVRVTRIELFDMLIHADPEKFMDSLHNLGEIATSQTVEMQNRDVPIISLGSEPEDLIIEYFTNRYDLDSEFDETTEKYIDDEPINQKLIAIFKEKLSIQVKTGVMRTESHKNPDAESARNDLRRARLMIYLARVAQNESINYKIPEKYIDKQEVVA